MSSKNVLEVSAKPTGSALIMFNARAASEGGQMLAYRAPSLFQPHRTRQAIRDAHNGKIKPLMGLYLGLSSIQTARFMAPMGFDFVWIDWEHSVCGTETMSEMCHQIQFMSEGKTVPFVRLRSHDHADVAFAIDTGANIVVPQVNTAEECQHVISAMKFGTDNNGTRSAPPFRLIPGLTDTTIDKSKSIWKNLNDQAAIMIQIETLEGIHNLDDILTKCPEVDAVWLGTLDARISMNIDVAGFEPSMDQKWLDAVELYNQILLRHNKPSAGFAMGDSDTIKLMGTGKAMCVVGGDVLGLCAQSEVLVMARDHLPNCVPQKTVNGSA